ncbi:DUF2058 domain-containing protein [Halopseudomonas sabulinigri]|uniref:DUF2058 domain-containing protein n=1 Tax=Halopseudomonas sabulinigri TaxID=472181 RepID=A0ABP9ZLD2_9GAMM
MVNSLQAQLLKAGLVDEKKLKQAQRAKKKAAKTEPAQDTGKAIAQARTEKAERDRQLNQQRQEEAARKEREAQVKQMVENSKLDRSGGETPYQFVSKNKIKKIHVTKEQFDLLSRGRLGITRLSGNFVLIPLEIAEKVRERAPHWPVYVAEAKADAPAEDDPYAAFQVPDDLMW